MIWMKWLHNGVCFCSSRNLLFLYSYFIKFVFFSSFLCVYFILSFRNVIWFDCFGYAMFAISFSYWFLRFLFFFILFIEYIIIIYFYVCECVSRLLHFIIIVSYCSLVVCCFESVKQKNLIQLQRMWDP